MPPASRSLLCMAGSTAHSVQARRRRKPLSGQLTANIRLPFGTPSCLVIRLPSSLGGLFYFGKSQSHREARDEARRRKPAGIGAYGRNAARWRRGSPSTHHCPLPLIQARNATGNYAIYQYREMERRGELDHQRVSLQDEEEALLERLDAIRARRSA